MIKIGNGNNTAVVHTACEALDYFVFEEDYTESEFTVWFRATDESETAYAALLRARDRALRLWCEKRRNNGKA